MAVPATSVVGNVDVVTSEEVTGWLAVRSNGGYQGDRSVRLELQDGTLLDEDVANIPRSDVALVLNGTERVGFSFALDDSLAATYGGARFVVRDGVSGQVLEGGTRRLPDTVRRVLVDVGDALIYFSHHATASGIQRVITEVCRAFEQAGDLGAEFVVCHPEGKGVHALPKHHWHGLLRRLERAPDEVVGYATDVLQEVLATKPLRARDDVLVVLGAPWISDDYIESVVRFQQQGGRILFLLYDLVPLRLPHMFDEAFRLRFMRTVITASLGASRVLTISDYTRRDFENYCDEMGIPAPTTAVTRLASALGDGKRLPPEPASGRAPSRPYVLFVSTIEGRKGHHLALRSWARLLRECGPEVMPDLVFVGREGWHAEDVYAELARTGNLQGKVRIYSDIGDARLRKLYHEAAFTIYPSTYEGWGLPVGESLMLGTPVIASDATSIPEVAGDFVSYFRAGDEHAFTELVRQWVMDPRDLAATRERIRSSYVPDQWSEVAGRVDEAIRAVQAESKSSGPPEVIFNQEIFFGSRERLHEDALTYARQGGGSIGPIRLRPMSIVSECLGMVILEGDIFSREREGRWLARDRPCRLKFRVPAAAGSVAVYLAVSSGHSDQSVLLHVRSVNLEQQIRCSFNGLVKVIVPVESNGEVDISMTATRAQTLDDPRPLGLFLRSLLVLAESDIQAQLAVLEARAGIAGPPGRS